MNSRKKWRDLCTAQRIWVVMTGAIQILLAMTAWWDLSHRPDDEVNGSKGLWAAIIAVNFLGPLSYFRWGRLRPRATITGQSA